MILVDSRTGSVEIAPLLQKSIICCLEYADFAFSGNGPSGPVNIGVERKTLYDFLQSMTTGRLSGHQIIGLTQQYDWTYILLEGIWRPDRETGLLQHINRQGKWAAVSQGSRRFMARDIYNFINTLQVMCNIITITTSNRWETAMWLTACHGWWNKEWGRHRSHLQFQKPIVHAQLRKPSLVTKIASQLTGIGWDKARKIGEWFGTPAELVEATEEELAEIEGIGPKLAERIVEEIGNG
jgi:ERCC4-type nuclease